MPTSTPSSLTSAFTHETRFHTPCGTAAPQVSHKQRRLAPTSTAAVSRTRRCSGEERTVSSVTYMTSSPSRTANRMASRVWRTMSDSSHSSAYWRMGLLPMKTQASIGTPVDSAEPSQHQLAVLAVDLAAGPGVARFLQHRSLPPRFDY